MTLEGINYNHEADEPAPSVERTRFSRETIARFQSFLSGIALRNIRSRESVAPDAKHTDNHNEE